MSGEMKEKNILFLLVEDDDDHAQLIMRHFEDEQTLNKIERVADGREALFYLKKKGIYRDKEKPDVVLLDLNLPRLNGIEVLNEMKSDPQLKSIPVVILTTSAAERDKVKAYQSYANSYVVKPLDFEKFQKMALELNIYWGKWNEPIPHSEARDSSDKI